MTARSAGSSPSVNGLRTLELGSALLWLREQLLQQLGPGEHSISLSGARTSEQQQVLGISQILHVMFPFAIELALKSLWDCFHEHGTYERRHDLDILFRSLDQDAIDAPAARLAQKQARELWIEFQNENRIHYTDTLDEFLSAHARDFVEVRYHTQTACRVRPVGGPCYLLLLHSLSACIARSRNLLKPPQSNAYHSPQQGHIST